MTDALRGAIVAALNAVLAALLAFGITLTQDQQLSVVAAVNALLLVWLVYRHRAKPNG